MKLPDPDTHCWDDDTQSDVWSYSKELVEQMLTQADNDFSDGMTVVHLQVADQMRRKYEPVLKMAKYEPALRAALSALKSPGDQAMQDRALGKINEALNG